MNRTNANSKGPILRVSKTAVPVGRLYSRNWQVTETIFNEGTDVLHIKEVISSCTCMTGSVDKGLLLPKESTPLRISGNQTFLGSFTYEVLLVTNQKDRPAVKVPVRGYLEPAIFFDPPAVKLEKIVEGQTAEVKVPLNLGAGLDIGSVQAKVPKGSALGLKVDREGDGRGSLLIEFKGLNKPGWYHYEIDVGSNAFRDAALRPLHLAVEVIPSLDVFPPAVLVCDKEMGGFWVRRLTVKFNDAFDSGFKTGWCDPWFDKALAIVRKRTNDKVFNLVVFPVDPGLISELSGKRTDLIIHFRGGGICKVPFYFGKGSFIGAPGENR